MNKSISIMGCGWLGFPVARQLVKLDFRVNGSTTTKEKLAILETEGIQPFQLKLGALPRGVNEFLQSDILLVNVTSKEVAHFEELIALIETSPISRVLFVSSTSVYDATSQTVDENTPTNHSPLVDIEARFTGNAYFETTVLRFAGLFGADRKPGNWFSEKKVPNPEGYVNMIHLEDCVGIVLHIIQGDHWGHTFNACADTHPSRREFYTEARRVLNRPSPGFETSERPFKIIKSDRLKEVLGYRFRYPDVLAALKLN